MRRFSSGQARLVWAGIIVLALPFACRDFNEDPSGTSGGFATAGAAGDADAQVEVEGGSDSGAFRPSGGDGGKGDVQLEPTVGGAGAVGRGDDGGAANGGAGPNGGAGAGGDAAGAGGKHALSPSSVPQLALWLEASPDSCAVDEASRVTAWLDGSTNGNHAMPRAPLTRPQYVDAAINGHAVLRFAPVITGNGYEPSPLEVADSPSLQFGVDDFTYLAVMAWDNDPQSQGSYSGVGAIIGKQGPQIPYPGLLLLANHPGFFGFFPSAPGYTRLAVQCAIGGTFAASYTDHLNDNQFRVYGVRRKGTDLALRINGLRDNATTISSSLDLSEVGSPLIIGGSTGIPLKGEIAELIALHGNTSDAELAGLEAYLMEKYALH